MKTNYKKFIKNREKNYYNFSIKTYLQEIIKKIIIYFFNWASIAGIRTSFSAVGSNLSTTCPSLSTKNLVKFHLISGFLSKSESALENISFKILVSLCLGSNPSKPYLLLSHLNKGNSFSPLTSYFANWGNLVAWQKV